AWPDRGPVSRPSRPGQALELRDVPLEHPERPLDRLGRREVDARLPQGLHGRQRAARAQEAEHAVGRAGLALVVVLGERRGCRDAGGVLERIERYVQVAELRPGDADAVVGRAVLAVALP